MPKSQQRATDDLNAAIAKVIKNFAPPEGLSVVEWADKYRKLSPESSAEAGQWRTSRTPYLAAPMEAFTDPRVKRIVMVAGSQIGKTECELNCLAYLMDQDPGTVIFVHPTLEDARKFSRLRIAPMIRDCPRLKSKIEDEPSGGSKSKTILNKSFPGGMLIMVGSNAASALASTPARYVFGDERDRWALSAGDEGDPWDLAAKRQTTFYNAKAIEVSTPTVKGSSSIEASYLLGTQEKWCTKCPHCGEYTDIEFDHIRFEPKCEKVNGRKIWSIEAPPEFACPHCGALSSEEEMRAAPSKWIASNPDAIKDGVRSYWLNAFVSPWLSWSKICTEFLQAKDNPSKLQVVYNTLFGRLWENRGDMATSDGMMTRLEDYGTRDDGSPVELPEGVLVLTCGVDTQDNRLEYEVVGHGRWGETWGIEKGVILGRPDTLDVWQRLDGVVGKAYRYKNGKVLRISMTCVDSGGHFTQEVYEACWRRQASRVFAIKGKGGEGVPYTAVPTQVAIRDKRHKAWLYTIGVDAGKSQIMDNLKVEQVGARYCHFPSRPSAGYDEAYFDGLLSERLVLSTSKTASRWRWEKLPGHERNEALDCRNYALAALKIINPDFDRIEAALKGEPQAQAQPQVKKQARKSRRKKSNLY